MPTLYDVQEAARLSGVSQSSIHNYTQLYANYFSKHANPPEGQPRAFTPQDVRLLAFIRKAWNEDKTHDNVAARINRGEFETFDFQPEAAVDGDELGQGSTALDFPQVRHFGNMLDLIANQVKSSHEREIGIVDENRRLHDTIAELQYKVGQTEGELESLRGQVEQTSRSRSGIRLAVWFIAGLLLGLVILTAFAYVLISVPIF